MTFQVGTQSMKYLIKGILEREKKNCTYPIFQTA